MDSPTHRAFGRMEIVETGRRRAWSEDEKARIVLESLAGPRLVSATARRHGISRSQLLTWRRTFKPEPLAADRAPGRTPTFVPMVVTPEPPSVALPGVTKPDRARAGRVEIVLARERRLIVDAAIDTVALARILDVLERR